RSALRRAGWATGECGPGSSARARSRPTEEDGKARVRAPRSFELPAKVLVGDARRDLVEREADAARGPLEAGMLLASHLVHVEGALELDLHGVPALGRPSVGLGH